jgi:hypothetical protein
MNSKILVSSSVAQRCKFYVVLLKTYLICWLQEPNFAKALSEKFKFCSVIMYQFPILGNTGVSPDNGVDCWLPALFHSKGFNREQYSIPSFSLQWNILHYSAPLEHYFPLLTHTNVMWNGSLSMKTSYHVVDFEFGSLEPKLRPMNTILPLSSAYCHELLYRDKNKNIR